MTSTPPPRYYRASLKPTPLGILLAFLFGAVAATVLGFAYAYISLYNPIVYVSFLATLALGFGVGFALSKGGQLGKLRSPIAGVVVGLAAGAVAVYGQWVGYIHAATGRAEDAVWVLAPGELWEWILSISETGLWSIRGGTPTGGILYALWAIEALAIVAVPVYMAFQLSDEPFCERCNAWTDAELSEVRGFVNHVAPFKELLESGDFSALRELGPASSRGRYAEMSVVTLRSCAICREGYLRVEQVTRTTAKDGQSKEDRTSIIPDLLLTPDRAELARELPAQWSASDAALPPADEEGAAEAEAAS